MQKLDLYLQTKVITIGIRDLKRCIDLDLKTLNGIWNNTQWEKELTDPNRICLGIVKGTDLLALATGWLIMSDLNITFLAVDPLYQRLGLGIRVLSELINKAKKSGMKIATIDAKETNIAAKALYKKMDFEEVRCRYNLYKDGNNAIIYQRLFY
ncbi:MULTISPECIES: GNAT family N-acetyltransferase [Prochlorococcus]|uniref:Acetyltransferase, GNAT family n=1 Tax=Prochlorococcus marinus (strain SARG / CCMP1375 / SS120) TaxID=167539 RepID=Q7VBI6_PROMA|nr:MULTISPECIES: GNAT family N-acetyltransferase [Prochlorococcus]AAQ00151.1 Acetyltransferase, GNAT family [Prochlorococcus marinus subsp. marinus str. CCMP1375]KGG13947.1 Ribosomal-protein-S18p-alanine acetyltransferase [Prochlorococcus marinus str. LG]KGG19080.1 Ribosomal-protein-S18p-alanine acetyltransferase [Prochlorococcus marinus str. SS2]KGG23380.1 Ribosomal-protein-S18p-alanine acetyltransferase [Prochlorococcus marinus str. SS35]KGG32384.1 Ribosomal-protein-S18p-alanine acetyltransf